MSNATNNVTDIFNHTSAIRAAIAATLRKQAPTQSFGEDIIDDLVSMTYEKVIKGAESYRGEMSLKNWGCLVAKGLTVDHLRRKCNSDHDAINPTDYTGGDEHLEFGSSAHASDGAGDFASMAVLNGQDGREAAEAADFNSRLASAMERILDAQEREFVTLLADGHTVKDAGIAVGWMPDANGKPVKASRRRKAIADRLARALRGE